MTDAALIWNTDPRRSPSLVTEILRRGGWRLEVTAAPTRSHQRAAARDAVAHGVDVVVVIGGDGTVVTVAQELANTGTPVGIVPGGTGNLIAVNVGIPQNPARATDVILAGHRRVVDLGRARNEGETRSFAVACGIGFDALVMERTSGALKRRHGRLAYALTAARNARDVRNAPMSIDVDGRTFETLAAQVLIANMGAMAGGLSPRRRIAMDDGLFDIVVLRADGPVAGIATVVHGLISTRQGHVTRGRHARLRGRFVRVSAESPLPAEIDGDLFGVTPLSAEIEPGAMTILAPRV